MACIPAVTPGTRLVTSPLDDHFSPRVLPFSPAMGNSASSGRGHHEDTVDFGYLTPQGIYTGPRDWNQGIVTQLIVERKLAPFYRPLEEYDESWDDEQILAARKEPPEVDGAESSRAEPATSSLAKGHAKRPSVVREPTRNTEAAIYRGAMECPICFLVRCDSGIVLRFPTLCERTVLPREHKPFTMLRPSYLHGMFRPNQESGTHYYPPSFRAGCLSVLRPRELRYRLHPTPLAYRDGQRRRSESTTFSLIKAYQCMLNARHPHYRRPHRHGQTPPRQCQTSLPILR